MRAKHTKGPWLLHRPSQGVDDNWHVTDKDDTFVAHVFSFNHSTNEKSEANARLIAAAPELLIELQLARQVILNALYLMSPDQKREWRDLNRRDDCAGGGGTRANERRALIVRITGVTP